MNKRSTILLHALGFALLLMLLGTVSRAPARSPGVPVSTDDAKLIVGGLCGFEWDVDWFPCDGGTGLCGSV
jgi:hypothetical protein